MIENVKHVRQMMPGLKISYARAIIHDIISEIFEHSTEYVCEFDDLFSNKNMNDILTNHRLKPLANNELREIKRTVNNILYYMDYYVSEVQHDEKTTVHIGHNSMLCEYLTHDIPQEFENDMKVLEQNVAKGLLDMEYFKTLNKEKKHDNYMLSVETSIMKLIKNTAYENEDKCVYHFNKQRIKPDLSVIEQIVNKLEDNGYVVDLNEDDMRLCVKW